MSTAVGKRFAALLCSAVIVFIITACDTKEQKEQNKINLKIAQEHVSDYISDKYGFEAEILDADVITYDSMWGKSSENRINIKLEHDGKNFTAIADIDPKLEDYEDKIVFSDDYQFDEIEENFKKSIDSKSLGIADIEISGACITDLYNGEDVIELLKDKKTIIYFYYVDRKLSDDSFSYITELDKKIHNFDYYIISCRSEKAVERISQLRFEEIDECRDFAPYISEVRRRNDSNRSSIDNYYQKYCIQESDGLIYMANDNSGVDIEVVKGAEPDLKISDEPVSPLYKLTAKNGMRAEITVFMPLSELTAGYELSNKYNKDDTHTNDIVSGEIRNKALKKLKSASIRCDYAMCGKSAKTEENMVIGADPVYFGFFKK